MKCNWCEKKFVPNSTLPSGRPRVICEACKEKAKNLRVADLETWLNQKKIELPYGQDTLDLLGKENGFADYLGNVMVANTYTLNILKYWLETTEKDQEISTKQTQITQLRTKLTTYLTQRKSSLTQEIQLIKEALND